MDNGLKYQTERKSLTSEELTLSGANDLSSIAK